MFRPLPTDDPKVRQPDITRARTLLGWEPKVPLEQGLTSTIDYFQKEDGIAPHDGRACCRGSLTLATVCMKSAPSPPGWRAAAPRVTA